MSTNNSMAADALVMQGGHGNNSHEIGLIYSDIFNSSPLEKMAAILEDNIKCILWNGNDKISIRISLNFSQESNWR